MNKFKHQFETHSGKICNSCKAKPIVGEIYHCLICKNLDLCKLCYNSNIHSQHTKFLMKSNISEEWKPAPDLTKCNKNLIAHHL